MVSAPSAPVGRSGRDDAAPAGSASRPTAAARASSAAVASSPLPARTVHLAAVGNEVARLAGVGEERDRRSRAGEHEVASALELHHRELREVGEALDRRDARAALDPSGERLARTLAPVAAAIRAAARSPGARARAAAEEERRALAGAQDGRDAVDGRRGNGGRSGSGHRSGDDAALGPRDVGGQDQRGHLPRRAERGGDGRGGVGARGCSGLAAADPARDVAGDGLDVGLERRVVLLVVRRVVADDVDHRSAAAARVVQVGEPVAEAGPEVQQRRGRTVGHAPVAVGGAGRHALEQREHAAHLGNGVERGDEVHLRRARIREARRRTLMRRGCGSAPGRRSSAAHRDRRAGRFEEGAGVEDAVRVERRLDPRASARSWRDPRARGSECVFSVPMPCSPEIAPPSAHPP